MQRTFLPAFRSDFSLLSFANVDGAQEIVQSATGEV